MYLCKAIDVCLSLSKTELCIATDQSSTTQKIDRLEKESPKEYLWTGKGGYGWRRTKQRARGDFP